MKVFIKAEDLKPGMVIVAGWRKRVEVAREPRPAKFEAWGYGESPLVVEIAKPKKDATTIKAMCLPRAAIVEIEL